MLRPISRIVDLLDPALNCLYNMDEAVARRLVVSGDPEAVRTIDGSFALIVSEGQRVHMARSMDRPVRHFLAKRHEGPALYVADRIDRIREALEHDGLGDQFHPSYAGVCSTT